MLKSKFLNQKGDTIVEVLIAVTVASSVLVGAFTISNVSLKQIRMAQERGEAQKIAQQQLESMGLMVSQPGFDSSSDVPYCKNPADYTIVEYNDDETRCIINERYHVKFSNPTDVNRLSIEVQVWWDGVRGTREQINYYYLPRLNS